MTEIIEFSDAFLEEVTIETLQETKRELIKRFSAPEGLNVVQTCCMIRQIENEIKRRARKEKKAQ